ENPGPQSHSRISLPLNAGYRCALRAGRLLLLGDERAEHGLLDVRLQRAARRIDEGIGAAILQLRELLLHVVLRAVVAELDVAWQRPHGLERAVERVDQRGRQRRWRMRAAAGHDAVALD